MGGKSCHSFWSFLLYHFPKCTRHCNNARKRLEHNGMLGISVRREFRGRGVGEALLSALLDWARANPLIEKVSLAVFADNAPAIALYRKLGFKEEGRREREIKFGEGQYKDDLLMAVWVK